MWWTLVALPFVFVGVFTRTYSLAGRGNCFWIDHVSSAAHCFGVGSQIPDMFMYGSMLIGFVLLFFGVRQIRRQRKAK